MKICLALLLCGAMFLGILGCGGPLPTGTRPPLPTDGPATTTATMATTTQTVAPTVSTTVPAAPTVPTTVPTVPITVPTVPTTVPTMPTTAPTVPTTVPTQPTTQPTTAPQPTQPPQPDVTDPKLWMVSGYPRVNLRQDPAYDARILQVLTAGTYVRLKYWTGKYACVDYNGCTGFIMSCYIKPADPNAMANALDTVAVTDLYSYEQMMQDLTVFHQQNPELVSLEVIGYSELGNQIPVIRIGDLNAAHHVLIQGAIHGREHMTAWLMMALADYWLDHGIEDYSNVCFHLIPMSNPDGVIISQQGLQTELQLQLYKNDRQNGRTYLDQTAYAKIWKANGLGVDLNRNFSTGWDKVINSTDPSYSNYKGSEPFSAAETRALRDYTLAYDFDATISYHAMGSVIYYDYGNKTQVNRLSADLARKVVNVTGYYMIPSDGTSHAGYKDWAIDELEIPSLTIEIGCQDAPLLARELYSIFARNRDILPALAQWVQT